MPKRKLEDLIKKIVETHPNIDAEQLLVWSRMRKELLEMGIEQPKRRRPASPLDRKRAVQGAPIDTRMVYVGRQPPS